MNSEELFGQEGAQDSGDALYPDEGLVTALAELRLLLNHTGTLPAFSPDDGADIVQALTRLAENAENAQYLGVTDIALRLAEHVREADLDEPSPTQTLLAQFAEAVTDYIADPTARATQETLIACLRSDALSSPPSPDEVDILRLMLGAAPDEIAALAGAAGDAPETQTASSIEETCPQAPDSSTSTATEEVGSREPFGITPVVQQRVEAPLLAMLAEESHTVLASFSDLLSHVIDADTEETRGGFVEAALGELESLSRGAHYGGLTALTRLLEWLHRSLTDVASRPECVAICRLLQAFPAALTNYLSQPNAMDSAAPVVELLQNRGWGRAALDDTEASALLRALIAVEVTEPAAASQTLRPVEASPEDVSLALPDDINPEILDGLLLELPIQSAAFTQATQSIVSGHGTREDIDVAKRAAHTLKGAANTVGVRGVANLTHYLEDILVALAEHNVFPNLGLSQSLSYAADCLEAMSEALTGTGAPPNDAVTVLQDVLNWANRIDSRGIEVARGDAPAEPRIREAGDHESPRLSGRDQPTAMLRVPAHLVDELLRLVGETITSTAQVQNRVALTMQQARAISRQNVMLQQLVSELETAVDLRGFNLAGTISGTTDDEFDALEFERYNELQTISRRLVEVATDSREMGLGAEEHLAALGELLELQLRLHHETQTAVLTTRMVPVSSVFSRLQRSVRQACRILDKEVELHLHGNDTVIDGNVLQDLIDPLMHLLRNSVDHGIESEQRRLAVGKPAEGKIDLSFRREGDYITVRCTDDGRGLDLDLIRSHAEERGIITSDQVMSDDEIARLVLIPGFSTREEATQVSGRGIGMDAVNSKVSELKGVLNLFSRPGEGLTVEVRLPITLVSAHALLVRTRNRVVAVSTRGIMDIHYFSGGDVSELGKEIAQFTQNRLTEVVELEAVLNTPGDRRKKARHGWPVLVVRMESGAEKAIAVQEILESRNLVVKTLSTFVPKIRGIVGAAILGDGGIAPVVDLPELLYAPTHSLLEESREVELEEPVATGLRQALVVDDSISARRAAAQVLRDAGYEVRTAVDGLDAIAILEQRQPDIVITDMEMPRMNGFELTHHLRARPESRKVPVIMITSRSTEKHRRQAELAGVDVYLTKPFNERELVTLVDSLIASHV